MKMSRSNQILIFLTVVGFVSSFTTININKPLTSKISNVQTFNAVDKSKSNVLCDENSTNDIDRTRKAFLASIVATTTATVSAGIANADEEFESIAARAAKISKIVEAEEAQKEQEKVTQVSDSRTVYDFTLPVAGVDVPFKDLVKQEFTTSESSGQNEGEVSTRTDAKVKAILVVNIKQDDPIARRNIPELISLAAK